MRTPLNLSLEIEIVNGLKQYSADHGVSLTSVLQEIICQFLGLKGLLDPELKAAIEERIMRRAGRPVDLKKKAEREKRAAEEQARVYQEAGVSRAEVAGVSAPSPAAVTGWPVGDPMTVEELPTDPKEDDEDRALREEIAKPLFEENSPSADQTTTSGPSDNPPPGPPIFKPESISRTERLENIVSKPRPICLRCMEVVAKCECEEGPEEG